MSMPWFKFYGQDFLADPKIKQLSVEHQLAWVYLLCLASQNDGVIKYLTEYTLAGMMGLQPADDNWDSIEDSFKLFEELEMITIDNKMITIQRYHDRQHSNLSDYERVKKHREKVKNEAKNDNKRNVINDNARLDKIRIDKDKNNISIVPTKKTPLKLEDITEMELQEIASSYKVSLGFVKLQLEKLTNYCASSGKRYKDYKAALRNFVLGDMQKQIEKPNKGGTIIVE